METFKSKIEFIQNLFYGLPVHSGLMSFVMYQQLYI